MATRWWIAGSIGVIAIAALGAQRLRIPTRPPPQLQRPAAPELQPLAAPAPKTPPSTVPPAEAKIQLGLIVSPAHARVVLFYSDGTRRTEQGPWSRDDGRRIEWAVNHRPQRARVEVDGYRAVELPLPVGDAPTHPVEIHLQRRRAESNEPSTDPHHELSYPWRDK